MNDRPAQKNKEIEEVSATTTDEPGTERCEPLDTANRAPEALEAGKIMTEADKEITNFPGAAGAPGLQLSQPVRLQELGRILDTSIRPGSAQRSRPDFATQHRPQEPSTTGQVAPSPAPCSGRSLQSFETLGRRGEHVAAAVENTSATGIGLTRCRPQHHGSR